MEDKKRKPNKSQVGLESFAFLFLEMGECVSVSSVSAETAAILAHAWPCDGVSSSPLDEMRMSSLFCTIRLA